jgi:hypothetical protein
MLRRRNDGEPLAAFAVSSWRMWTYKRGATGIWAPFRQVEVRVLVSLVHYDRCSPSFMFRD